MSREKAEGYLQQLVGWIFVDNKIEKEFRFKSYLDGLNFAYGIGNIAEEQDHHPDILIKWCRVRLTFSTHVIKGLSQNDFIMAAKAEIVYQKYASQ